MDAKSISNQIGYVVIAGFYWARPAIPSRECMSKYLLRIETIQATALLKSTRISWKALENWGDCSEILPVITGVKIY